MEKCDMKKKNRNKTCHKQPIWKRKIHRKIKSFRGEICILEDLSKQINVKTSKGQKIKRKYNNKIKMIQQQQKKKKKKKKKVKLHFESLIKFFKIDAQKFYREMTKEPIEIEEPPSIKEVEKFWKKPRAIKNNTMKS